MSSPSVGAPRVLAGLCLMVFAAERFRLRVRATVHDAAARALPLVVVELGFGFFLVGHETSFPTIQAMLAHTPTTRNAPGHVAP